MIKNGLFSDLRMDSENHYKENDFIDQLVDLGEDYLKSPGIEEIRLTGTSSRYLKSIYDRLVKNSELIFDKKYEPKFHVIDNPSPFYFSLPQSRIFISSGLLLKYLKNEQLLVAALAHEVIKSQKNLYEKNVLVPVGYMTTEKMLSITRIPLEIKTEVNKWTYYMLRRAGYDSSAYLNWLQAQNKNTLEFTLQYGDTRTLSREEFMYKNFLVTQGFSDKEDSFLVNSSSDFYKLLREVKRGASEIRTI
jgi:hypothetical protein